jgi:biopolymer transport protein ExbD
MFISLVFFEEFFPRGTLLAVLIHFLNSVEKGLRVLSVSRKNSMVENNLVLDEKAYSELFQQKEFLIKPLYELLVKYSEEAVKMSEISGSSFSGEITIQGDVEIPYNILTRVMYTCGQAGYPNMNLFVSEE